MVEYRESRRRSRSRSRDRKAPAAPIDERPRRRKRLVGWNDPSDRVIADSAASSFEQQQIQLLALQQQMGNKKAREIYCGNLASGQVSGMTLREHFNQMFSFCPNSTRSTNFSGRLEPGPFRTSKCRHAEHMLSCSCTRMRSL